VRDGLSDHSGQIAGHAILEAVTEDVNESHTIVCF
jgi:hypothetical protein